MIRRDRWYVTGWYRQGGAFGVPPPLVKEQTPGWVAALRNFGLGQRVRDRTAIVDDALEGSDHAARVAALPDVAAKDDAGRAGPDGVVGDPQRLLDGLHPRAAGDQDRRRAVVRNLTETVLSTGVVRLHHVGTVLEGEAGGGSHGVGRFGVRDPLARTGQRLDHQRQVRAHALAGDLGDYAVGLQLDRDADKRHHHHAIRPEKEGILDRMQKAPLRVGQPVFAVGARTTVQPEDGGNAPDELLPVALHHAEGGHHGICPGVDRRFDHGVRTLEPFDGSERAGVVHGHYQRPAVGRQHGCAAHVSLLSFGNSPQLPTVALCALCYATFPLAVKKRPARTSGGGAGPRCLERVRDEPQSARGVPGSEGDAEDAEDRGDALEVPSDRSARYREPEGGTEERHREGRPRGEEQERHSGLGLIRDGGEQEQREAAGAADAVYEPDAVR